MWGVEVYFNARKNLKVKMVAACGWIVGGLWVDCGWIVGW